MRVSAIVRLVEDKCIATARLAKADYLAAKKAIQDNHKPKALVVVPPKEENNQAQQ